MSSSYCSINDYNAESSSVDNLLDIRRLGVEKSNTKLVLCEKCIVVNNGNTDKPFIRYNFRDCTGKMVIGRQWNIDNLTERVTDIPKYKNTVISITFTPNYWKGIYLDVTNVALMSQPVSSMIKAKFFTATIPDIDKEQKFFSECVDSILINKNLRTVYNQFDTELKLNEGYYAGIMDGMKGSPIKIVNVFSSLAITMFDKKQAKLMTKAFLFIEAILAESYKDNNNIFRYLSQLKDLCLVTNDSEVFATYTIVERTLDLMFGIQIDMYASQSIFIDKTRKFIVESMETLDVVNNSIGIFSFEDKIFERK